MNQISQIIDLRSYDIELFFSKTESKHSDLDFILQDSDSASEEEQVFDSYKVFTFPTSSM